MDYQSALEKLHSLQRAGISPGLERIEELCRRLGNPERELSHSIHITGTNGKGSVAVMLESILRAAGRKTALFTSPHLSCHTERYRINGQPISYERFAALFQRVYQQHQAMVAEGLAAPTEFETVTALALLWFSEEQADHAIIEVGLGGATDSTNVLQGKMAILTNVGLDHGEFLGNSIAEIAHYKAGIIKEGATVITAAEGEALDIIRDKCEEQKASLSVLGEHLSLQPWQISRKGSLFDFRSSAGRSYSCLSLPLVGEHQLDNAALAVEAAEQLSVDEDCIRQGLSQVVWPGRLELLPGKPAVLLDGAHNYAGMSALCRAMDQLWPKQSIVCVLGMLSDKERERSLQLLLPRVESFVITRPPYLSRSCGWQSLVQLCLEQGKEAIGIADNTEAIAYALRIAGEEQLVLVCGSLYMVAAVRKHLVEDIPCFLQEEK